MDRKDFLKHVGVGLVAATGALGLIKSMNGVGQTQGRTTHAYGASAYGGPKKSSRR